MSIQLLTVEESAAALKVTPETVRRMIKRGELRAVKVARRLRVSESALLELQSANEVKPDTKPV